eukprot:1151462-Pelagomonas_calceolata.AAC.4
MCFPPALDRRSFGSATRPEGPTNYHQTLIQTPGKTRYCPGSGDHSTHLPLRPCDSCAISLQAIQSTPMPSITRPLLQGPPCTANSFLFNIAGKEKTGIPPRNKHSNGYAAWRLGLFVYLQYAPNHCLKVGMANSMRLHAPCSMKVEVLALDEHLQEKKQRICQPNHQATQWHLCRTLCLLG